MKHVVGVVAPVRDAARHGTVELDLRAVKGMDRVAGTLLTQELFNSARHARVVITAPERNWESLLAQSGLLFFLASHVNHEVIAAKGIDAALGSWSKPWTRGSHAQRALFDEGSQVEPTTFRKREYAAFVNPHLSGAFAGGVGVSNVVQPWLAQFVPPRIAARREFLADIGLILDELLSNVGHHAATVDSLPALRSLVLVTLARGNHNEIRDRVHITVLDTGMGILVSAHRHANPRFSPPASQLFRSLFKGEVQNQSKARGFGLPQILQRVRSQKGARLYAVANGHFLWAGGADIRTASLGVDALGGSAVTVTLAFPSQSGV